VLYQLSYFTVLTYEMLVSLDAHRSLTVDAITR
jgi:hypothetical protein